MRGGPVHVGSVERAELDGVLEEARRGEPTYDHVGSTLGRPGGREVTTLTASVEGSFDEAVEVLRAWRCHDAIGAEVHPPAPSIAVGETLLVVLRVGPLRVVVPNRIVAVVDEPGRFGFAYGTLPGHQERGEECFLIEQRPDGTVHATIRVDAVPATLEARLLGPAIRPVQRLATRRYLRALSLR